MTPKFPILPFALVSFSLCLYSAPAFPPSDCGCAQNHTDKVLTVTGCPGNVEVRVSQNGGNGTISFSAFLNQAGTVDNRTYVIEKSTAPYIWGCRQVNIGAWSVAGKRSCVVIRGATGDRRDVVLAGADPATTPNFWQSSEYGGPSSCGIGQVLQIANAEHIVIADLTMRNFAGKMIKIDGGKDGATPWAPRDILIHNVELWDCGSQMIKVAGVPVSSDGGVLECSYLHYTDGLFANSTYETQGIDVHTGRNWVVRDNVFEKIRQRPGKPGLGSAILMWDVTRNVLAERNLSLNCNFGIKFGATWYADSSDSMTARNNVIVYDDPDPNFKGDNTLDIGLSMKSGGIFHNTVWNPYQDPASAFAVCANNYRIENNIYSLGTTHRCNGLKNNLKITDSTWFVSVGLRDYRLKTNRTVPAVPEVTLDGGCLTRGSPATAGAFEYAPFNAIESTRPAPLAEFRVFPNPCRDGRVRIDAGRSFRITLYDALGKRVAWQGQILPSGIYQGVAEGRGERVVRRFVVAR